MSGKMFGRVTIRIDGQPYKSMPGATLDLGGIERTARPGDNDADGFTTALQPSKCDFSVQMRAGVSLAAIQAIEDGTLSFECDTGQTYMIRHAYSATPPSLGGEGVAKCTFQGAPAEEIL